MTIAHDNRLLQWDSCWVFLGGGHSGWAASACLTACTPARFEWWPLSATICSDLPVLQAVKKTAGREPWIGWLSVCSPNTWKIGALIWVEQHCQVSQTIGIRPYLCFACSEVLGWGPKKARGRFYWAGHICSFSGEELYGSTTRSLVTCANIESETNCRLWKWFWRSGSYIDLCFSTAQ